MYVKGYTSIVIKILVQLLKVFEQSSSQLASDFLDLDLAALMDEVQQHIDALNSAKAPGGAGGKKKQETASSIFDDFYGSVLDENPYAGIGGAKKDDGKKASNNKCKIPEVHISIVLEQEFEEGFIKLVTFIREDGEKVLGLKEFSQRAALIDFLKRFK